MRKPTKTEYKVTVRFKGGETERKSEAEKRLVSVINTAVSCARRITT